jgi:pyridoxine kinase
MASVLIISSQVARGCVGASAQRLVFERLGHEAWVLPTILLSNHPAHATFSGHVTETDALAGMVRALDENGWLGEISAILTGYMPSLEHAAVAAGAVNRVREEAPWALHLCDPAMGDAPTGLYVDEAAAQGIRLHLMPLADIATPNHFELEWLTGRTVEDAASCAAVARELGPARVLTTSMPMGDPARIGNLLISGKEAWLATVERRANAPHGTGDLIAALFLAHLIGDDDAKNALVMACAGVDAVLEASGEQNELALVGAQDAWLSPTPWPLEPFDG